jgi:hypothetical protein
LLLPFVLASLGRLYAARTQRSNTPTGIHLAGDLVRVESVADGDVGLEPLAREDGEDLAVLNDDVGELVAAGDREAPRQISHAGDDKPSGNDEPALRRSERPACHGPLLVKCSTPS